VTFPGSITNKGSRQRHELRGRVSELLAAAVLRLKGYRILERRHRSRAGEIDLIAVRGKRLAFVEVKLRPTIEAAEIATTGRQATRMARAAEQWVWRHPGFRNHHIGLDALLCAPWRLPQHRADALQPTRAI
jgi:putative endonuclease